MDRSHMTNTANNTAKPIAGTWKVTGRGKTAKYYAMVKTAAAVKPGAVVALKAKSGAITYGRLNGPAADLKPEAAATVPAGHAVWTFERAADLMTPEMRAENAALKADARAEFLRSEAGIAQAARIAERAAKRDAEAAAGIPDTTTVTVTRVQPAADETEQPAATLGTVAETIAAFKAAGFTVAEIMAAMAAPAAVKPAAVKPAGRKPAGPINLATLNAKAGTRGK